MTSKMDLLISKQALTLALCLPLMGLAQQPPRPEANAPSSLTLQYRSAFDGYLPYQDVKRGDWVTMNDAVADAGGMSMSMPMATGEGHSQTVAPAAQPTMHMGDHSMEMPSDSPKASSRSVEPPTAHGAMPSMKGMREHEGRPQPGANP